MTTAVVIGGTHGIGLAMASALVSRKIQVLVTGRSTLEPAQQLLGPDAVIRSDISSMADIAALAEVVAERFGQVDALFVNAGVAYDLPVADTSEELYDRTFAVNTKGAFFTTQRLLPLISEGGSIVFTSSIADTGGSPEMGPYGGSKAALWSFAQTLAAELMPRRIRVNAVSPGFIDTPTMGMTTATKEERAAFSAIGDTITPMRRHGTPEEVAAAAMFLAFEATFTTGVKLPVDGGLGQNLNAQ